MNILIFNWRDTHHSWAGGSELYIHELAKRWKEKGNTITLLTAQDPFKRLPEKEIIDGIEIYRKGGRFSVYFWAPFIFLFHFRNKVDVIVDVENGIPFFTPLFTLKKKVALVYHVHGRQFFYELKFPFNMIGFIVEKYIFPILYRNVPIMSISKSSKAELEKLGFKSSHIFIVNPGVSSKPLKRVSKYRRPTLIYLGRIKRYKRLDLLMDIFPKVLERVPKSRLIVAGWGTEAPQISDIVMKNGFRKNIILFGPVSEKEKRLLLQRSWLMVNPSLHEGWGISIIEANAYGTPSIAFKVPGLSDAIKNNKTGYLSTTTNDFIEKVTKFLLSKSAQKSMEKEALRWATSLTWDKAAKKSYKLLFNI